MIGQKFGEWTVIGETRKKYRHYYLCRCSCGGIKEVRSNRLINGQSLSCHKCVLIKRNFVHGLAHKERLYGLWKNVRQRCQNKKHRYFKDYGGRGIDVCSLWDDYLEFKKWCFSHGYEAGLQIDRIDNNLGYSPDNCRFTTSKANNRNRRDNVYIFAFGENKLLMEWVEDQRCSVSPHTLGKRINRFKWQPETAITKRSQRIQQN